MPHSEETPSPKESPALQSPSQSPSLDGGGSIGGGDILDGYTGAAWFLGHRTIQYCVEQNARFPLPESIVNAQIEKAFQTWEKYISDNGINSATGEHDWGILAIQHNRLPRCQQGEDLQFLIGVETPAVTEEKKKLRNPVAFSKNFPENQEVGWAKGFIWLGIPSEIKEFESLGYDKDHLLATLLHELGHVHGNGHIADTVMTHSAVELINYVTDEKSFSDGTKPIEIGIDRRDQLYPCVATGLLRGPRDEPLNCKKRYYPAFQSENTERILERWLGRKTEGPYTFGITMNKPTAIFSFSDQAYAIDFPIKLRPELSDSEFLNSPHHCNSGEDRIFYRVFAPIEEDKISCAYMYRVQGQFYSSLTRRDGLRENLLIKLHIDGRLSIYSGFAGDWEELSFKNAEEPPNSCDITTPILSMDRIESLRVDVQLITLDKEYDPSTAKKIEKILYMPLQDLYYAYLPLHTEAIFSRYSARLLKSEFGEMSLRYSLLMTELEKVKHLLNQKTLKQFQELEADWNSLKKCFL